MHLCKIYFGCVAPLNQRTLEDFSYVLTELNAACHLALLSQSHSNKDEQQVHVLNPDEHITSVWADDCDATLTWHIGVVESVDNERAIVSKLIQKYIKRKANWMHPKLHFIHLKIHFTRPKTKLL